MKKFDYIFTKHILELIDKCSIYRTIKIRNDYIQTVLRRRIEDVSEHEKRKLSRKISNLNLQLLELDTIEKYGPSNYKNLVKNNLVNEFDKRMSEKYLIINIKNSN